MVKEELVSWMKNGLDKGHEMEKLLAHLKKQGYTDSDIIALRAHIADDKPAKYEPVNIKGNTFAETFRWVIGTFMNPKQTLQEVAEKSRLVHVSLLGGFTLGLMFITFLLNNLLMEGIQTVPMQMLDKFNIVMAPQGTFWAIIGFGDLSIIGILANIIAAVVHYFLPILGIAFVAHLILHGLYHKSKMWTAYKIIGVPYGAVSLVVGLINLAIIPILFFAEIVGSETFLMKSITAVLMGGLVILIFFTIVVSIYSYVAYAMAIKEKYGTNMTASILIAGASTGSVVLALLPLMAMFVSTIF